MLDGNATGTSGLIANNNVICISEGATLKVIGADVQGRFGAKAGIELADGKTLCIRKTKELDKHWGFRN